MKTMLVQGLFFLGEEYSEKWYLRQADIDAHEETFLQEIEPLMIADILLEDLVITIEEDDELESAGTRREKSQKLLTILKTKNMDLRKFTQALQKSKCFSVLELVRNQVPQMQGIKNKLHHNYILKQCWRMLQSENSYIG